MIIRSYSGYYSYGSEEDEELARRLAQEKQKKQKKQAPAYDPKQADADAYVKAQADAYAKSEYEEMLKRSAAAEPEKAGKAEKDMLDTLAKGSLAYKLAVEEMEKHGEHGPIPPTQLPSTTPSPDAPPVEEAPPSTWTEPQYVPETGPSTYDPGQTDLLPNGLPGNGNGQQVEDGSGMLIIGAVALAALLLLR